MTFNPDSLVDLGMYWSRNNGVNLGVIGNQKHCGGYHLGKDRIFSDCACKPDGTCEPGKGRLDYSVKLQRDKNGLSNAASAIDLGRLNDSLGQLYRFSRWLVVQCQARKPGTSDIREIIYSPDGHSVQRFSGVDGLIHTGPGNGDLSHRTHTHISYYRDSEHRDKRPVFIPYFLEVPDTGTEVEVVTTITVLPFGGTYVIPANASVTGFKLDGPGGTVGTKKEWAPRPSPSTAAYDATMWTDATRGDPFIRASNGFFEGFYIAEASVEATPNPPPVVDCGDAVAAARERDRTAHLANVEEVYAA